MRQEDQAVPSLENNIACAITDWYGPNPIVVADTFDALIGTIASIAVKGGTNTAARRKMLADHLRMKILYALESISEQQKS